MLDQCHNVEDKIPGQIRSRAQRAGDDGAGAARRPRGARRRAAGGRRARRQRRSSWTPSTRDVRPALADWRESRGLPAPTRCARYLRASRLPEADRRRTASAARRPDGEPDPVPRPVLTPRPCRDATGSESAPPRPRSRHRLQFSASLEYRAGRVMTTRPPRADRPLQPARRRPEEHQLRRRQHLGEGHRDRPRHRRARRAALGQGLRRRPRHADRVGPRRAAPRPAARARRASTPASSARTRWSPRSTTRCFGKGGAAPSIDTAMHGLVDAAARRPPAPRLRHRDRDGGRRRGADARDLRRQGRLGALAPTRLPARPGHRRDQGREPAGDRLHPRRPRHHGLGRHLRRGRGELALDHRHRRGVHRRPRPAGAVRRRARRLRGPARGRAARARGRPRARHPRPRVSTDRPHGRPLHRRPARARLPGRAPSTRGSRRSAPAAPTTSCAPRSSRSCSTCRPTASVEESLARLAELHDAVPRRLPGVLRPPRDRRLARRCAAPIRRSC